MEGISVNMKSGVSNDKRLNAFHVISFLGLLFSMRDIWSKAISILKIQSSKTSNLVYSSLRSIGNVWFEVNAKNFYSKILPILSYGAEIWGGTLYQEVECVQINYFKRFLGASKSIPGQAVLGDCGRHSLLSYRVMRLIKFWLKIIDFLSVDTQRNVTTC